jgi:hypothetical protein
MLAAPFLLGAALSAAAYFGLGGTAWALLAVPP